LGGACGAQPQWSLGRLHRLLGHGQQLGGQGIQVDLLVQPAAERLDCLGGVVATAVKAAVDRAWDARNR
jgi:hypothetical protein